MSGAWAWLRWPLVQRVMKFRFITAVWGGWHREAFLTANLPSLLAPRNLPLVSASHHISFEVYTSSADAPVIAAAESYRRISELASCKIRELSTEALSGGTDASQPIWKMALDDPSAEIAPIGLMAPDMVWADDAIERLMSCFAAGKRALYMTVLRVIEESFMPAISATSEFRKVDGTLVIPPRRLAQLAIEHFHPLHIASIPDCPHRIFHFEHFFFPVSRHALLARTLSSHCLAIDPGYYEINKYFSPSSLEDIDRIEFAAGVDGVFGVSLTPLMKDLGWYEERQPNYDSNFVGKWSYTFFNPVHEPLSQTKFPFYAESPSEREWQAAETRSDDTVQRAQLAFELVRLWHTLGQESGDEEAAKLLALAIVVGKVADRWRLKGPATLFMPSRRFLQSLPPWWIETLLGKQAEGKLADLVARQTVSASLDLRTSIDGPSEKREPTRFVVRNIAGEEIAIEDGGDGVTVNGARVIHGEAMPNGWRVYTVDGLLEANFV